MLTTLLAAAEEPTRGWGGPIALAAVAAIYVAGATIHHHIRSRGLPSPTEGDDTTVGVNAQVSEVSDTDDTTGDTGWWGRLITLPDGRRVRSTTPAAVPVDEEDDTDLDGGQDEEEPDTIEDVIGQMLDRGHQPAEIVRHTMEEFEVSESTAWRRLRDVRAERIAAAS